VENWSEISRSRRTRVASDAPLSLLPHGIFDVSNARASTDWPKIALPRAARAAALNGHNS